MPRHTPTPPPLSPVPAPPHTAHFPAGLILTEAFQQKGSTPGRTLWLTAPAFFRSSQNPEAASDKHPWAWQTRRAALPEHAPGSIPAARHQTDDCYRHDVPAKNADTFPVRHSAGREQAPAPGASIPDQALTTNQSVTQNNGTGANPENTAPPRTTPQAHAPYPPCRYSIGTADETGTQF